MGKIMKDIEVMLKSSRVLHLIITNYNAHIYQHFEKYSFKLKLLTKRNAVNVVFVTR